MTIQIYKTFIFCAFFTKYQFVKMVGFIFLMLLAELNVGWRVKCNDADTYRSSGTLYTAGIRKLSECMSEWSAA